MFSVFELESAIILGHNIKVNLNLFNSIKQLELLILVFMDPSRGVEISSGMQMSGRTLKKPHYGEEPEYQK